MDPTSLRVTVRRKDGSTHVTTVVRGDTAFDVSRRLEVEKRLFVDAKKPSDGALKVALS